MWGPRSVVFKLILHKLNMLSFFHKRPSFQELGSEFVKVAAKFEFANFVKDLSLL